MNCKNCGHDLEGNFCSNCGQEARVRKINYKYILEEIPNSLLQINHGFLYTVKELFLRPGHSLREFMQGKRKSHYKPLAFLLITSALYSLIKYLLNTPEVLDLYFEGESENFKYLESITVWIRENETYSTLIFLPFFALASYLAFLKFKYNYFEHFVLNMYIVGQKLLIQTFFLLVPFENNIIEYLSFIIPIGFSFWTYTQFFNHIKFFKKMFRFMLMYLLIGLFFGVTMFVLLLPLLF
ncbi:DUF3667 domain-containing protein [Brumimicrobium sp.]|uniref:DUF3667 domain-containing protein n=1 Tax=Brumimicrobium sp. TaxID=2029867 RepID=UPI003A90BE82